MVESACSTTCQPAPFIVLFVGLLVLVFGLVMTAVTILIYCRIFSKAGYHWALGLLMLVPIANIIMPFVLAFGDWPALKELRSLRQQQNDSNA